MTTHEIVKITGKSHSDVMRDISRLKYKNTQLTKKQCYLLSAKYTIKQRLAIINEFSKHNTKTLNVISFCKQELI